jgi:hypothetical protein
VKRKTASAPAPSWMFKRHGSPFQSISGQVEHIYAEAFPPSQRVDYDTLTAAVAEGSRLLFTAQKGGQVLGFAITTPLPDADVHCLEYFAVRQGDRSQGIGAGLLRTVLSDLHANEHVSGLILEVEPEQEGNETEQEIRRARVAFYLRNGATPIADVTRFLAPDLSTGGTIEMKLMWLPTGGAPAIPSGPELWVCIRGIYSRCYGLTPEDPRVEATLRSAGCPIRSC